MCLLARTSVPALAWEKSDPHMRCGSGPSTLLPTATHQEFNTRSAPGNAPASAALESEVEALARQLAELDSLSALAASASPATKVAPQLDQDEGGEKVVRSALPFALLADSCRESTRPASSFEIDRAHLHRLVHEPEIPPAHHDTWPFDLLPKTNFALGPRRKWKRRSTTCSGSWLCLIRSLPPGPNSESSEDRMQRFPRTPSTGLVSPVRGFSRYYHVEFATEHLVVATQ